MPGRLAAAVALVACLLGCAMAAGEACAAFLAGYASTTSAAAGDTIGFHVSGDCPTLSMRFYRHSDVLELLEEVGDLVPADVPVPDSAWIKGCGWPTLYTLTVPPEWKSGMYYVEMVPGDGGPSAFVSFVVRQEGPPRPVLVVSAVNTYQAYNAFGGKSLYDYNSPGGRAPKVTFDRPYDSHAGLGQPQFETPFVRWFERAGFQADFVTDVDLALRPQVVDGHRLLVIVGHNEYWSRSMLNVAQAFADSGGNVAVFGGNTCYWQVRYEDDGRTLVCYKSMDDPILHSQLDAVTVQWRAPPIRRPECILFGVMYPNCAGTASDSMLFTRPYAWITEGLEDQVGRRFGDRVVGYEYDTFFEGRSPAGAIRLFETPFEGTPCPQVQCATYYERQPAFGVFGIGGGIFAAGTIQWSWGLDASEAGTLPDPRMQLLTANLIHGLSQKLQVSEPGVAVVRARIDGAYVTPNMPISCEPVHVGPDATSVASFPMLDDGNWPDEVANDDVYAGQFPLDAYERMPLELRWSCATMSQAIRSVRPRDWFWLADTQHADGIYERTIDSLRVDGDLVGVPLPPPPTAFRLLAAPNPFASSLTLRWTAASVRRLTVHDAHGRLVATVPVARGEGAATWDGRDAGGHASPAGVYWARAEGDLGTRTVRIVKLR